jgi:hypothetical protein
MLPRHETKLSRHIVRLSELSTCTGRSEEGGRGQRTDAGNTHEAPGDVAGRGGRFDLAADFGEHSHDRQIITEAPNVMWAIDATQVTTVEHGSNFMAKHFQKQGRFWGISPSYAFVGEP